jgi:hypothetical protein
MSGSQRFQAAQGESAEHPAKRVLASDLALPKGQGRQDSNLQPPVLETWGGGVSGVMKHVFMRFLSSEVT